MHQNSHKYEIRDVIHGLIGRSPLEVQIINTPVFQRLRRIRQLAMANLVYPGAHHSRFEHSLGTMHVAGRIATILQEKKLSDAEMITIRLAALLHDIGHGPFSHVSEHLLEKYYDQSKVDIGKNREKIHERVTKDIINNHSDLETIMSKEQRAAIIDLLDKGDKKDFKSDIVSGPLDADKLDYLLRDNYYTGVKYGLFDLDKIIESLRIISFGKDEAYLGISEEGIYALEQLILAKYHMTTQVYFHRIRGITDAMIVRGIETAVQEGVPQVLDIYKYDGTTSFINRYCEYHDSKLTDIVRLGGGKLSSEIFARLYSRNLYKLIHCRRISEIVGAKMRDKYNKIEIAEKEELEKKISEKMKINPAHVILHTMDFKKPIGRPEGFSITDNSILVELKGKDPEKISDIQWSILNFKGAFDSPELRVYAPFDKLTAMTKKEREKEYKKLDDMVCKILYS